MCGRNGVRSRCQAAGSSQRCSPGGCSSSRSRSGRSMLRREWTVAWSRFATRAARKLGAGWLRTLRSNGQVVDSGFYSTARLPGRADASIRVAFPLPNGSVTIFCVRASSPTVRSCSRPRLPDTEVTACVQGVVEGAARRWGSGLLVMPRQATLPTGRVYLGCVSPLRHALDPTPVAQLRAGRFEGQPDT